MDVGIENKLRFRYYLIRRILSSFVTVLLVILVAFILIYIDILRLPGEYVAEFGANKSFIALYFTFLKDVFTGNLGYLPPGFPFFKHFPLSQVILLLLPDTLQLLVISMLLSLLFSIPVGTHVGLNRNSTSDMISRIYTFAFYGMPIFFTSLVVQMLFAKGGYLGFGLPDTGPYSVGLVQPSFIKYGVTYPTHIPIIDGILNGNYYFALSALEHLIMPAMVLALWTSAAFTRFMRNEIIDHMNEMHVTAARSRGIAERQIVRRYIRRNSYIPFVTVIGPLMVYLVSWIVLTETIFGYPGIGNFVVASAENFYMVGVAVGMMILGIILVGLNLIADILYAILDPKIRY